MYLLVLKLRWWSAQNMFKVTSISGTKQTLTWTIVHKFSYLFSFSRRKIVDVNFCLTLMCLLIWSHEKKKKKKLRNCLRITWPFGEEIPLIGCPHLTTLPDHWRQAPPPLNRLHAIGWRNLSHAHQKPSDACDRGKRSVSRKTMLKSLFFLEGFCSSKDVKVNFLTVMNSTDITVF